MQESKVKTYLETATNVAVLIVSILVLSVFAWHYLTEKPKLLIQSGLQKGTPLAPIPGVDYSNSPRTLLVAMNLKCDYCRQSLPFYKQLVEVQRENDMTHLLTIFPDTRAEVELYKQQNQFNVNTISGVDFRALNIDATPTLVLVNSKGIILDFWIGKIPQETEQQIVKAISNP